MRLDIVSRRVYVGLRLMTCRLLACLMIARCSLRRETGVFGGAVKSELSVYLRSLAFPVGNRLFSPCNDAFRKAVGRSGLELPDGQLTHILWHTFASHFPHQWRGHPRATTHPRAFGFEGHYV